MNKAYQEPSEAAAAALRERKREGPSRVERRDCRKGKWEGLNDRRPFLK